jgi:hypothetical protein
MTGIRPILYLIVFLPGPRYLELRFAVYVYTLVFDVVIISGMTL